jgi:hypothetical protein
MKEASGSSIWSSKALTCEPSSTSWSVRVAATIRPLAASSPIGSFFQAHRRWVACFPTRHSPGPHSLTPVLSTNSSTAPPEEAGTAGRCRVRARRLSVEWSGTASSTPSRWTMEAINPSVWRSGSRYTARRVNAVVIARSE